MPKFYIPVVMVIEAPDYEAAARRADSITNALSSLAPLDLCGFHDIDNLEPIEAPDAWYEEDLYITTDGKNFILSIAEL